MRLLVADFGSPEYEEAFSLRNKVLREPLGMRFDDATREEDLGKIHCVGLGEEGEVIAVALVTAGVGGEAWINSVVVAEDRQGMGLGGELIGFSEKVARGEGARKVFMDSRKSAVGFYERLGYAVVGEEFIKVGIPHLRMEKELGRK